MPPKLSRNGFKQRNDKPNFDENLIKSYDEDSEKRYILKVVVEYPRLLSQKFKFSGEENENFKVPYY